MFCHLYSTEYMPVKIGFKHKRFFITIHTRICRLFWTTTCIMLRAIPMTAFFRQHFGIHSSVWKLLLVCLKLHWNLLRMVQFTIWQHCSITMGRATVLGPLISGLRATIDHHGPAMYSAYYTSSVICCKKRYIATRAELRSLEWLTLNPLLLHMQ